MLFLALLPACGDAQLMIRQEFSAYAKDPLQAESLLEAAHQYSPEALTRSASTPSPHVLIFRDCSSENHLIRKPPVKRKCLHALAMFKFFQRCKARSSNAAWCFPLATIMHMALYRCVWCESQQCVARGTVNNLEAESRILFYNVAHTFSAFWA